MQKKLDDLWEESKKVGLEINPLKTEEIRINTIINQVLRLNVENIKRSSDFCYLGSVVAEDGGASTDVNVRNTQGYRIILQTEKSVAIDVDTKRY
jgi:hypothetical protein